MINYLDLFYISISIIVTVILFQISSFLGRTIFSTGISILEIEDISNLLDIKEDVIRMIPISNNKVNFKILDDNQENVIGYIIFDIEFLKILEKQNIEIDSKKLNELRRLKFAKLIKVDEKYIQISEDGNTFMQIENDKIIGSVTFDNNNELKEVKGIFEKYF